MLPQIGTMLYTSKRQWKFDEKAPVGASTMMVPVTFAMLLLLCAVVMLTVWLLSAWWTARTLAAYTKLPQVLKPVLVMFLMRSGGSSHGAKRHRGVGWGPPC